jgi:PAS domain S-box-containing protein
MSIRTLTLRRAIVLAVMVGLLVPALLIVGFSWLQRYDEDIHKRTQELLQQNADVLSNGMQEPLWNVDHESGAALLESMMHNEDIVRIEVRDSTLGIFVASEHAERRHGYTASIKQNVIYRKNPIGSIQIEVSSTRLRKIILENLNEYIAALTAQVALAVILILVLLDQRLIRPLRRLGAGAENLASGVLDTPFTWNRLDEIGVLSQRLEATRIALRRLFDELGQKNQELEQDIDKRKRVEQILREREARFRTLVEQSPIAIIEWDLNFCVIEWNTAAERIFGYPRAAALGRHASFIVPGDAGVAFFQAWTGDTKISNSSRINQNLRADGAIITCQWNNSHIADESGHTGRLLSMAEDITAKRRSEEAQRLSEAKFSSAFQCHPDSVAITRLSDGMFLDVNQTFEQTTGFSLQELIGKSAVELQIWRNPAEQHMLLELLTEHKMVRDFSWDMQTKQGRPRKCLINATIFNVGDETYMLAVMRDVTDQLRFAEQKAEADSALLRLAQGTQGMGNESFFQLLVTDLASALRTHHSFIGLKVPGHPDRVRTMAYFVDNHLVDNFEYGTVGTPCQKTLAGEFTICANNVQSMFPSDTYLSEQGIDSYAGAPLRDAAGHVIGVLGVLHNRPLSNPDLVKSLVQVFGERASSELERKRAEEALRNSERSFSSIFHSSPVAMSVIHIGDDYKIKDVNSAFEHLFLHKRQNAVGKNTVELNLYCDHGRQDPATNAIEKTDTNEHFETWMNRSDGRQIFVQISQNSFSLMDEQFVTATFEDITEQFNNELTLHDLNHNLEQRVIDRTNALQKANQELASTLETLNRAQEDLVRSEKLAALGALVAGIAHELNTPIGNTLMVASTLIDQTQLFASEYTKGLKRSMLEGYISDVGKAGDIMIRNLHRAADLVTSFKQVAVDQTSSQRRQFSLAEVIAEIVMTLWPSIKKTAFGVIQNIPKNITMDSYPGPLGQVLTNLVNNALIHGFEGRETGTILIEARTLPNGWIELTLQDDGIGIPSENLKRIYDPFFTTKLGAGGSGLGLNITHNIVTGLLGGRIAVASEVDAGTKFTLTLPRRAPAVPLLPH